MKKGGRTIYSGPLGQNSQKIIEYFERIPGVPKIRDNYNPATWMLEVTSKAAEEKLGIDFADVYIDSSAYWDNKRIVEQLSIPTQGSSDLHFIAPFSHIRWLQFTSCLWKLSLSYWRSPTYNLVRLTAMLVVSVLFAALFWQKGKKITNEQDLSSIMGSMYLAVIYLGVINSSSVLPIIARERVVMYREVCAGTYTSFMYSLAQVIVEIPCSLFLAAIHIIIIYPSMGYYWSASKITWYYYIFFCTVLCCNYLGMLIMSVSPNIKVATVLSAATYTFLNLFSGFLIPKPHIPTWWTWLYYICPTAWSLNGLLTSQYGDLTKEITAFGKITTVDAFMRDYYGFNFNQLSTVAATMACFPLALASLFSYSIWKLNFQRR